MKTAVEWLEEQQKELVVQIKNGEFQIEDFEYYNAIYIAEAKEMEKKQIGDAYERGFNQGYRDPEFLNTNDSDDEY